MAALSWVWSVSLALTLVFVSGNSEGDALYTLRRSLSDPDNILQSWDPTLVNPCTWFHITCNQDNRVTRVSVSHPPLSIYMFFRLIQLVNILSWKLWLTFSALLFFDRAGTCEFQILGYVWDREQNLWECLGCHLIEQILCKQTYWIGAQECLLKQASNLIVKTMPCMFVCYINFVVQFV